METHPTTAGRRARGGSCSPASGRLIRGAAGPRPRRRPAGLRLAASLPRPPTLWSSSASVRGRRILSIALGMACCQHDYRVRFVTVTAADVVHVDELGYVPLDKASAGPAVRVHQPSSYERRSLVVTTNLPFGGRGRGDLGRPRRRRCGSGARGSRRAPRRRPADLRTRPERGTPPGSLEGIEAGASPPVRPPERPSGPDPEPLPRGTLSFGSIRTATMSGSAPTRMPAAGCRRRHPPTAGAPLGRRPHPSGSRRTTRARGAPASASAVAAACFRGRRRRPEPGRRTDGPGPRGSRPPAASPR